MGKKASLFSLSAPFLWEILSLFHFNVCTHPPQLIIPLLNSLICSLNCQEVQSVPSGFTFLPGGLTATHEALGSS